MNREKVMQGPETSNLNIEYFVLLKCDLFHTFHFFRDRVARFTGEGDFLGDDGTTAVFFAPRFGAGDFLAGDLEE